MWKLASTHSAPMRDNADYSAAWRDLRRRRRFVWIACLGYVPGVAILIFIVGAPLSYLTGIKLDYFVFGIAGTWMVAVMSTSVWAGTFRCPRCHRWFFAKWWYSNSFARKCVHCGLPKWATGP